MTTDIILGKPNPDLLIAYKPAGVSFHAEDGDAGFVAQVRTLSGETELHAVHRLDRITSGLVLFARNVGAARELGAMFEEGRIEKYYLAISDHKPSKKQGWIKGTMEKSRNGSWRLAREGKLFSVTQFFSFGTGEGLRLFVVRPRTGRTHQIRVALKSLGAPILGDERYGGAPSDRGYLHAFALRLTWRGEALSFVLPPSEGQAFSLPAVHSLILSHQAPWELDWPAWSPPAQLQSARL